MEDPSAGGELQFERAEFSSPQAAVACTNCGGPAAPEYHELAGKVFCTSCRQRVEGHLDHLRAAGNMPRAFLYGLGAAIAGSLAFYAVTALTGYQVGLISLVVGWLVGRAVRKGSGSLGGRRYQIMAVLLTYASIASSHVPDITRYIEQRNAAAEQTAVTAGQPVRTPHVGYARFYAFVFVLALALPFLNITRDVLGAVIIAIGLWEAWKFTRGVNLQFAGPFAVSRAPSSSTS